MEQTLQVTHPANAAVWRALCGAEIGEEERGKGKEDEEGEEVANGLRGRFGSEASVFVCSYVVAENALKLRASGFVFFRQLAELVSFSFFFCVMIVRLRFRRLAQEVCRFPSVLFFASVTFVSRRFLSLLSAATLKPFSSLLFAAFFLQLSFSSFRFLRASISRAIKASLVLLLLLLLPLLPNHHHHLLLVVLLLLLLLPSVLLSVSSISRTSLLSRFDGGKQKRGSGPASTLYDLFWRLFFLDRSDLSTHPQTRLE